MRHLEAAPLSDRSRADGGRTAQSAVLKHALVGLAGASIEWYDFLLYATAAALVFPTVFFPRTLSPVLALIASFSTLAVGFLARPVGAVLLGHIGDSAGRKVAFAMALITMGTATTLIGVLPPYASAGAFSPVALILLRFLQGLAVGGQWGGAVLFATESAPPGKLGLFGSIAQLGLPSGTVLANLALLIASVTTSPAAFMAYGWRIPFLLSIALIALGLYIQFRVEDTRAYRQLHEDVRSLPAREVPQHRPHRVSPVLEALRTYPKVILLAAGANLGAALAFYILITYVVAYGTNSAGLHLSRTTMLTALLIAQVAFMPCVIAAGALSDRYGRLRVYMVGVVAAAVWMFVFFPMIETRSFPWITVAIAVGLCFVALSYGPMAALYAELFGTGMRYSGVSLAYQASAIVGGGLGPIAAAAVYAQSHNNTWVSVLIAVASVIALLCAANLKQTAAMEFQK